jgi:hypothetical protein
VSAGKSYEHRVLVLNQRIEKATEFLAKEKRDAARSGNQDCADTVYRIYEEVADILSGDRDGPVKLD